MSAVPFLPPTLPKLSRESAMERIAAAGRTPVGPDEVCVLAIRGYRHDDHLDDQRGVYDDAFCILAPNHYSTYSGNTNPSIFKKGIATIALGDHYYRPGWHKKGKPGGHPAFRPATKGEELPVTRDGILVPWPGVATNLHRGGSTGTHSAGCLTLPPTQWPAFYHTLIDLLRRHGQEKFRVILIQ